MAVGFSCFPPPVVRPVGLSVQAAADSIDLLPPAPHAAVVALPLFAPDFLADS